MIRTLLRYTVRTVFPAVTRPRPVKAGLAAFLPMFLARTFFSSVRTGRPLLAAAVTGIGLIRWLRRMRAEEPRRVAMKKRVKPGHAVRLRYMDGRNVMREEIIEG